MKITTPAAPMRQRQTLEFPYKHSTGETIGRFLAGFKEQAKIWGQRVAGQGVVVPPLGYSELDGSPAGAWVEVKETGTVTAVARVDHPIEGLHPVTTPFAFVLVKLDGADTAMAHLVRGDLDRLRVGSRVQAVWAPDGERKGHLLDITGFRVIQETAKTTAPPRPAKRGVKPRPRSKAAKAPKRAASKKAAKPRRAKTAAGAKRAKPSKRLKAAKKARPARQRSTARKRSGDSGRKTAKRSRPKGRKK
jgi:uncharacterized OB-fold protein